MLTLDDLDHFADRSAALLTGQAPQRADAETLARLARIVACLNFCRDIPNDELAEGGLHSARRALKSLLRSVQRKRRFDPDALTGAFEDALLALGDQVERPAEPADAAAQRHAVEAEIQAAAGNLLADDSLDPQLVVALACGEFELLPSSNIPPLSVASGKLSEIDVDLMLDGTSPVQVARVHLVIESSFWRWSPLDGCCMSRNGEAAQFLSPDDGVVRALVAGLAVRNGRAVLAWAEALDAACS